MKAVYQALALVWLFLSCSSMAATPSNKALALLEGLRNRATRENWTFSVAYSPVMEHPVENVTGLIVPENWQEGATFVSPRISRVATKFDWREEVGGLTPVKNQKSCGSCWAFGTVAVLESVIKIRDGLVKDLSEQQLVSCNSDGWSCGGGWFAHDLHKKPGATSTAEFPYVARDVACKSGLTYGPKIVSWNYVGGSENTYPTNEQIKAAISQYGPVAVSVSATGSFQAYSGGIYNANDGRQINHMVSLVGWNDEGNYWIMKNSWGKSWGEEGYMRIGYRVNRIGEQTTYVDYKPACAPQPMAYAGDNKTIKIGESTFIGGMGIPGTTYQWSPELGLDNATVSSPLASPTQTTNYTLKAANECGTATKSITVTVKFQKAKRKS